MKGTGMCLFYGFNEKQNIVPIQCDGLSRLLTKELKYDKRSVIYRTKSFSQKAFNEFEIR